ncbi:MAG: shikimate kinase [Nitriliruptoraceae bacterium]|nr:shikimate kinase [Nitriliruptoraceae bacterium]
MSRNLCLVGMMGVGKSTVAARVADRLGRRLADTDEEIRTWTGRSIPELFAAHGEAGFRELERRVVEELSMFHDLVIALGGGAVLRDDNVASLLLTGAIVHLDAPPEVLVERLTGDTDRPLLAGDLDEQVRATHAARDARYRQVSDATIDAARPHLEVAEDVIAWALHSGDVLTPSEHEQVMT